MSYPRLYEDFYKKVDEINRKSSANYIVCRKELIDILSESLNEQQHQEKLKEKIKNRKLKIKKIFKDDVD